MINNHGLGFTGDRRIMLDDLAFLCLDASAQNEQCSSSLANLLHKSSGSSVAALHPPIHTRFAPKVWALQPRQQWVMMVAGMLLSLARQANHPTRYLG